MNKVLVAIAALMFAGSLALAADNENSEKATTDTSKNPITGSTTVTKKYKKTVKKGDREAKIDVTEKTKTKKDGSVETKVDAESETETH